MESKTSNIGRSRILAATASALVAAALLPGMIAPATASAAQETRTYTWRNGEAQPAIPQTIVGADGQTMTLTSQSTPRQVGASQTLTQFFQQTADINVPADQGNNILAAVPKTYHINSDGYVGDIPLVGQVSWTPVNRTGIDHREETVTIQVSDPNATPPANRTIGGYNYSLKGFDRKDGMKDSAGNVITWNLICVYQYDRPYDILDYYVVHASYAGNITKNANSGDWTMSVVYTSPDPAPAPAPVTPNPNPTPQPEATPVPTEQPPAENQNAENANANLPDPTLNAGNVTNPFENGMNRNNSNSNSNSNVNNESSNNGNTGGGSTQDEQSIPWPLIIGCGVGALALIGLLAFLLGRRKKNKEQTVDPAMMAGAGVAGAAAGAGVAGAAGAAGGAAAAGALVEEEPACQLIAVLSTPEGFDQDPKANLTLDVSGDKDVPSVVKFPSLVDEYGSRMYFEAEDNASYWIAIDPAAVDAAVSDKVIVASDDGQEIYRGKMDTQFQLDTNTLVGSLNDTIPAEERKDISAELAEYASITDVPATAAAVYAAADDDFNFDDDFDSDFEDEDDDEFHGFDDITVDTDDGMPDDEEDFPDFEDDVAVQAPVEPVAAVANDDFDDFDDFDDDFDDFEDFVDAAKDKAADAKGKVAATAANVKADLSDDMDDFKDMLNDIK